MILKSGIPEGRLSMYCQSAYQIPNSISVGQYSFYSCSEKVKFGTYYALSWSGWTNPIFMISTNENRSSCSTMETG